MTTKSLQDRVTVVTGASRGLGAAVARHLAAAGSHVVLIARTVGGLEEVDDQIRRLGGSATLVPLDLTEFDKIAQLGPSLFERFGRVDALVGAAAQLGQLSPVPHGDPKVWQRTIDIDLTANHRLLTNLHPLLAQSPSGRAVFVTAAEASGARPFWYAYAVAKAGLETMVRMYAEETRRTPIRANLVDPGPMRTRLRAQAFPGEAADALPDPDTVAEAFVALAGPDCTVTGETIRLGQRTDA